MQSLADEESETTQEKVLRPPADRTTVVKVRVGCHIVRRGNRRIQVCAAMPQIDN